MQTAKVKLVTSVKVLEPAVLPVFEEMPGGRLRLAEWVEMRRPVGVRAKEETTQ